MQILCKGAGEIGRLQTPLGPVPFKSFHGSGLPLLTQAAAELVRARTSEPKPIFYIQGHWSAPAAILGLAGVPADRILYHTQDYLEPGRHGFWEWFERRLARRVLKVVTNEPNRARTFASSYGLERYPLAVRTALPRSWPVPEPTGRWRVELLRATGLQDAPDSILVVAGGPCDPARCGFTARRALRRLPLNYGLVFTGRPNRGHEGQDTSSASKLPDTDRRVATLAHLSFSDLLQCFAACDIGLLLYPNDGLGNYYQCPGRLSLYLRCGLPVVCSNFPGLELLTLKYGIGQTCDPQDEVTLARAILALGSVAPEERVQQRARLQQLAEGPLAFDEEGAQLENLLLAMSQGQPART